MKKNNYQVMESRGFVADDDVINYEYLLDDEIIAFLNSNLATHRTIAAKLIVKKSEASDFIDQLINTLLIEKKLYPRIAISEALGDLGRLSAEKCTPFLGVIGNNQHVLLPTQPFKKSNYPLPRDIVARTICKIGNAAIPVLLEKLDINNIKQLSEGIDAIGYISYYQKNTYAKDYIFKLTKLYKRNHLILWKLIRALQAFSSEEVVEYLQSILKTTTIQPLKWESKRSLQQIYRHKSNYKF